VEVDLCAGCGGGWLDKSELYHFSSDPAELQKRLAEAYKKPASSGLKCPSCSVELARVIVAGVEIEACPKCGGNWFDALELELLTAKPGASKPSPARDGADRAAAMGDRVHSQYSGPGGQGGAPVSTAALDPKADWNIAPNPRPAGQTFVLIGVVVAVCAGLAAAAALVLKTAFPHLF
jgi:Zn-finger nucleic acid-binding protein